MTTITLTAPLTLYCAQCGGELEYHQLAPGGKIKVTPCPGCMNNAECDGYFDGTREARREAV